MTDSVEQTASRLARFGDEAGPGSVYLLVVDNDSSSIFHLPHAGAVVIGRAPDCGLYVSDAQVDRIVALANAVTHRGDDTSTG